jgi:colanic acid/amylovoran biosynthesis glycosyltransferase
VPPQSWLACEVQEVPPSNDSHMRIALVTASLPYGPGEAFLVPEIQALIDAGHEIRVIPVWPRGSIVHGDAATLERLTWGAALLSPAIIRDTARHLLGGGGLAPRLLTSKRPRIAVKNLTVKAKGLWLSSRLREWKAEHVHAYWGSVPASLAWIAATQARIPWSFTLHRWDIYENNLLSRKLKDACFCRCVSSRGAHDLAGIAPTAPPPRILHVGVRVRDSAQRVSPTGLRILVPASLLAIKGHTVLLEALALLKSQGLSPEVTLAGDGPLRSQLEREASQLGLERVRFLGAVPHEELLDSLRGGYWSIAVLPSLAGGFGQHEGIPVALLEAMEAGLAVVATRSGSIPELVTPGSGLLVEPGNAVQLADGIRAMVVDSTLRHQLAMAGPERVRADFDVDSVAGTLASWFRGCSVPG